MQKSVENLEEELIKEGYTVAKIEKEKIVYEQKNSSSKVAVFVEDTPTMQEFKELLRHFSEIRIFNTKEGI